MEGSGPQGQTEPLKAVKGRADLRAAERSACRRQEAPKEKTMNQIVLLFAILVVGPLQAQVDAYSYLGLKLAPQEVTNIRLKETYVINKSKGAKFKERYLFSREEYNEQGKRSLNLFFKPDASLESKIVAFYPDSTKEINIFQQKGEVVDSAVFLFHPDGRRKMEVWYWGDNCSTDSLLFSYNARKQLSKVFRRYDWDEKWDTLFYKVDGSLDKAIFYSKADGLQKQVDFLFSPDSFLLKTASRNRDRLIIEEEYFFYDKKGRLDYTTTRYFPDGEEKAETPRLTSRYSYWRNGELKRLKKVLSSKNKKRISVSVLKYNRSGRLIYQRDRNKSAGIDSKIIIEYRARPKGWTSRQGSNFW